MKTTVVIYLLRAASDLSFPIVLCRIWPADEQQSEPPFWDHLVHLLYWPNANEMQAKRQAIQAVIFIARCRSVIFFVFLWTQVSGWVGLTFKQVNVISVQMLISDRLIRINASSLTATQTVALFTNSLEDLLSNVNVWIVFHVSLHAARNSEREMLNAFCYYSSFCQPKASQI